MPFFSVVVPVYNRAYALPDLIRSLQAQSFKDFETILVDDGSSDDPEAAVRDADLPGLKLIRQSNAGGSAARNRGIDAASGRYIAFLDSDDEFLPEKLERMKAAIDATEATMLFSFAIVDRGGSARGVKPSRGPAAGEPFEDYCLVARQPAQTSTLVVETELARRVRFDESLKKFQDIDFGIRLSWAGARIHFVPEKLVVWNDSVEDGRVGNRRRPEVARDWLRKNEARLGRRAFHGYRSNILSYEIGNRNPVAALYYIAAGKVVGGVSLKRSLHSAMRAVVPQRLYRSLVNTSLRALKPR